MTGIPHVVLDCTAIPANHGGVARYVDGLLRGLDPAQIKLTLTVQRRDREAFRRLVPWAKIHSLPPFFVGRPVRFAWEQIGLPWFARRVEADVVHSPHYTFPLLWTGGRVVTLHDATFFSDPQVHRPIKRFFFQTWIRLAWRRAGAVVTPSLATASEVERFLGPPTALLEVAPHGVNGGRFHPPTEEQLAGFRKEVDLAEGAHWFAFLGTIEPRKNMVALLDAYAGLRREFGDDTPQLLVSGGRGWDKQALARLDSLGENSGVHELGYLPMASLPALLGGSVAVMYPSLGEGFGLPVLEAMSCGAAVITTNRLAIPEVGGDAVRYTEVDADSIRDAMRELHLDENERVRFSELAVRRASFFSWHATAASHITAYRSVLKRR
jgi:glycosyltransferase involved in cell wall biosynthesis